MSNSKKLIVMVIAFALILILSSSYAILRSTKVGQNDYVINVGDLKVIFKNEQTEALNLTNMEPMSDEEGMAQEEVLSFTIENTGTVGSYYDISIEELSNSPEFKSVIKYISSKDDEGYSEPKVLSENKYIELTGYIESRKTITYKVKAWLAEEADNTYMGKEFKAKIALNAYQESNYAKDVIKSELVKYSESSKDDFAGGLVAINIDGDLYNETDDSQEIREYRYSGGNVNNYVTFNDETWRIVGVFKDENGEEHIKIVRNEVLKRDMFPETFEKTGVEYKIQYTSGDYAYWNKKTSGTDNNDWATSGLQYYLNSETDDNIDGYLNKIQENFKNMIETTKNYLGTVTFEDMDTSNRGIKDTSKEAYFNERAIMGCKDNKGPIENNNQNIVENNNTCRVWANNQATWYGKVALLYPSDYGYSTNSNYWNTKLSYNSFIKAASNTSWLQKTSNHTSYEWMLSPVSDTIGRVAFWNAPGDTGWHHVSSSGGGIRPSAYLKSNVKIISGDGTSNRPWQLIIE